MSESGSETVPAWSRLAHIGAHAGSTDLRPQLTDLGIDKVHRACDLAWTYSRADFEPYLNVELKRSQWRETCAIAGSMAESLMLSAATYVEAVWHSNLLEAGTEPPGMAIAQRYLADTAVDTAVSVGHRLINYGVRVARTVPITSEALGRETKYDRLGPSYEPFSTDHRRAWLSLNKSEIKELRRVLPADHHEALNILRELECSTQWKTLFEIRNENFHRWRKEHESVVGVDAKSGNARDIYDHQGNLTGRAAGGHSRRHTAGDGLTERTTTAAGAGIRVVADALDDIINNTLEVLPRIADGFTVEYDGKRLKLSRAISHRP